MPLLRQSAGRHLPDHQRQEETKQDEKESYRSYRRTITLPRGIKEDQTTATCRNGVLELHLAKTEASTAKHIPIQVQ